MKYRVVVFIQRPRALWKDEIDESDVVYDTFARWLWVARLVGRGNLGNTGRCGFKIFEGTAVVDRFTGPAPCMESAL